jgi:hypothetical protein
VSIVERWVAQPDNAGRVAARAAAERRRENA